MARTLLAALVLTALVDGRLTAQAQPLTGFNVSAWSVSEDRTLGPVRALAQDRDGYLWLGTESGLLRFDGLHFVDADILGAQAMPKVPVRSLFVARDGTLWIGLADGRGVYCLRDGHFSSVGTDPSIVGAVTAIAEDDAGTIWIGHDDGLLLRPKNASWMPIGPSEGFTGGRVFYIRASAGILEVGTPVGLYRRHTDATFARVPDAGESAVRGSATDGTGELWITDPMRGIRALRHDDTPRLPVAARGGRLLQDTHGDLWLATIGQGLWRIRGAGGTTNVEHLTVQGGLTSDGIWALLEDREGNLWVGTHEGLNRLTRHRLTPVTDLGVTSTIVSGHDAMWVGSTEGLIQISETEDAPGLTRSVFPLSGVRTLHEDASHVVWVAGSRGVYRFLAGHFTPLPGPAGVPLGRITAITSSRGRTVWLADAGQGLWKWDGTHLSPVPLPAELRTARITALHADRSGALWIALEGSTLVMARPDRTFERFGPAQGLVHDTILSIHEDDATGLWIAGSQGLSHLVGGRFVTIGRSNGLPSKRILGVTTDNEGQLWLALANIGIGRLEIAEFNRAVDRPGYRARLRVFDTSDGLAGVPTALDSRTAARSADGRLWFITGRGLTIIDPRLAVTQPQAGAKVLVEAAIAGDQRFPPTETEALPSATNRLRIDYTSLNLTSPEKVRFRYRLDGFDDDWRDAASRRQAFYTNLPPGRYRFHVQTADSDGGWNGASTDWSFSIAPRFYQTWVFYLLCGVGLLCLVAVAWQVHLRQVRRDFALVLAERTRLSREIHDTLLQSMVGVALQIDNVAKTSPAAPGGTRRHLLSIRRDIEDCIVSARQAIWNMRAPGRGHGDLIAALENAGADATADTAVRFRLRVAGTPRRHHERVETELLRIAQEALGNAVRHAHPTCVVMDLRYDAKAVTLKVTDDGTGFETPPREPTRHFGLATMRERAEHLGGHFSLTTGAGTGTEVETTIPVSSRA